MGKIKLLATGMAIFAGGLMALPGAAWAAGEPYPPGPPALSVSPGVVVVNNNVTLTGTGYGANEVVNITVSYAASGLGTGNSYRLVANAVRMVQTTNTDDAGAFTAQVQLDQVGTALITADGMSSETSRSVTVQVIAASGLPVTGGSNTDTILWGAGLLGVGLVLAVIGGRRFTRKRQKATA